ncbi:unnamed protein product, partial [Adineta steineri]
MNPPLVWFILILTFLSSIPVTGAQVISTSTKSDVCGCNQTVNLLARSEYFKFDTNIPDDQLVLKNLFTPPHNLTFIRSNASMTPTLTFSVTKGPVDLTSIHIVGSQSEFIAYVTLASSSARNGRTALEPIRSNKGVIEQCFYQVYGITLELANLTVSPTPQMFQMNITACET